MSDEFQLEAHPLVLMKPRVVPPYGWVGHIPFAYLAVDLLRPRRLVELGTHSGNSYLAFCQAVSVLDIRCACTAVDAWQGDAHALHYGEQVYQSLRARHDPLYGGFSQLLRAGFDQAVEQFADGSIDLLHIDGLHTYEAVRHDFETWLPRLSDRAVVLLHDTAERERGFGVAQFFEELATRYPCFEFRHSHGLGVVAVGAHVPAAFVAFMHKAANSALAMQGFFAALAGNLVDADEHPVGTALAEEQPVSCHLFYRRHDESYNEARMLSVEVDPADGVLDLQFRLPAGVAPDYLRIDPADLAGVFAFSRVAVRQQADRDWSVLDGLPERLGHVHGELLPAFGEQSLRLACFDDDPNLEFEIGSVLSPRRDAEWLDVAIRVEYEAVIRDPALYRLLERQAQSPSGLVHLSHQRIDVQNLAREFQQQRQELQQQALGLSQQRQQLQDLSATLAQLQEQLRFQQLALQQQYEQMTAQAQAIESQHSNLHATLKQLQHGIELLARRGLAARMRRLLGRGR